MNNYLNQIVGGRYFVLRQIGKGGFSQVYKVKDTVTGKVYAMKQYVTSDPANKEKMLEGMERELKALKGCLHPVLPQIYNIIKEEEDFFLIMEYVEGLNLKEYIGHYGKMKNREVLFVMSQVCNGLYYLHSLEPPIIYRDLKPSNIILTDNKRIKLVDFGIAKRYNHDFEMDEQAWGTKGFAAPEQMGDQYGNSLFNTDIRTDIYGIGTTMYYLKTGKIYCRDKKMWNISSPLRRIIKKCTVYNPDLRYQDCIEVLCAMKSSKLMI